MSEIRITELAAITGFAPTTIRFYESTGLLPTASRSAGGHRVYSTRDVDRLRFVARGKHMGLALDEIRELVLAGDADVSEAGLDRLVETIESRIAEVDARIVELSAFSGQLVDTLRAARGDSSAVPTRDLVCRAHWAKALAHPHTHRRVDGVLTVTFPTSPALTAVLAALVTHESECLYPTDVLLRCTVRTTTLELAAADHTHRVTEELLEPAVGVPAD